MIGYKAIVVSKFYEQSIVHSIRKVTKLTADTGASHYDDDEIAYFTVRWKTRASFVVLYTVSKFWVDRACFQGWEVSEGH